MTDPAPTPPLWQVMNTARLMAAAQKATGNSQVIVGGTVGQMYAAELRAVADWLVPHEDYPPCGEEMPWPQAYQLMADARWEAQQTIRCRLLVEADRAEAGE